MTETAPGKIELVTTYFEIHARPARVQERACPAGLTLVQAPQPPIHFYRYLYDTIGSPWVWWERKRQSDARIAEDLHHPQVELFVPYIGGVPVGMSEIDWRSFPEVKLPYFGVVPEYCALGIGGYLLDWTVDRVFERGATRFWLTTCSLDSPRAIPAYLRAGFTIFDEVREWIDDPRAPSA
jgi:GNAT superfamily N-acetyltransferase